MASFVDSFLLEPARFPFDGRVHCVAVAPGIAPVAGVLSGGKHAAREGPMQVSEILKVKGNALFTIAPEGKLTDAVSVMAQHNMGSLVVIDKGRMVGMLTFKEVLMALDKGRGALDDARVSDTMEHDPVTASPAMEVNDLRRTMIDSGARYLPVMDRDKLLGVISFRDVAKAVLEEQDFENRMLKGYIKNWPE
jgi:CBS domain-containing protein